MKTLRKLTLFSLLLVLFSCAPKEKYKTITKTDKNGYTYQTVTNDPLGTRIYTLNNGLKIYLSVNKEEPRINTYIAVKAGSSYDPKETTGLAHYLEHMMFKGTSKIATKDWEKEKVLIAKISDLYEKHKNTSDPKKKADIYKEIDKVSGEAAKYAIANEYDKLVSAIGAKATNAHTWYEETIYKNDIPSNELKTWLEIEKERFSNLVLRLFHTELETVYEEFNMSQDRDSRKVNYKLFENLFKKHPYGQQTTLGKAEHLKNPSMVNIHNYFDKFYVPNNMAICMSGDLDFEKTVKLIDGTFGKFERKADPVVNLPKEDPIAKHEEHNVYGPDAESLSLGFRFKGVRSADEKYVKLIDMILNNSKAGLIDINLLQKQKVLGAGCYNFFLRDYGIHTFYGRAKKGQKLEEVKDLILSEIEKVKKGEFDEWLLKAIVNDFKLSEIRGSESNNRASKFYEAFIKNVPWEERVRELDELSKITKAELVKFANENYKDNYVVVYKRKGEDKNIVKVDKPKITAIEIDRAAKSDFLKKIESRSTTSLKPVFVDFNKEIKKQKLASGITLDYVNNNVNELFSLSYIIDMGKNHSAHLPLAVNYIRYLGTDKYSAEELQKELYKHGLSFNVSAGNDRCYVSISGLNESFEKGIEIMEHIMANIKPDAEALKNNIKRIIKSRSDSKLNKSAILFGGMVNYAKYGDKSEFTNNLSNEALESLKADELCEIVKDIFNYKHKVYYYGIKGLNEVASTVDKYHKIAGNLRDIPAPVKFKELDMKDKTVYFVNYDMVQAQIVMVSKDTPFNEELIPFVSMYGNFYGSGLSSIVFQEIRESKALAYSASSWYTTPAKKDKSHYINAYVATQADKLKIATDAMMNLLNNMPEAKDQFASAKNNMLKNIETSRVKRKSIYWRYLDNLEKGIKHDTRKDIYNVVKGMSIKDFEKFFNNHIKGHNYTFAVLGNKDNLDKKVLQKLGKVKELSLEEIFGY